MKLRTHNVLTVSTLCVCALALTGWTGALPAGSGSVALVTAGLIGLAVFPSIAPTDRAANGAANEDAGSDTAAS